MLLLLGALPLEAELHRKKLAISVINSDNPTLKLLVQRQSACSHDIKNSFFNELTTILQQYKLPSPCQLFSSTKLQWKHMCRKAINSFWTKQLVSDIKTKKTLKYLPCYYLRVDNTHQVWRTVDISVMDVKKAVVKARILTGTYILQKNRQTFSNGTVSSKCRHCHLEEEGLLHLVSRCPAFCRILADTISSLRDIIINYTNTDIWKEFFCDWTFVTKTIVCAGSLIVVLPDLKNARDAIEKLSRDFLQNPYSKTSV